MTMDHATLVSHSSVGNWSSAYQKFPWCNRNKTQIYLLVKNNQRLANWRLNHTWCNQFLQLYSESKSRINLSLLMKNLYSAFSRSSLWTPQNTSCPRNSHTGAASVSMLQHSYAFC